MLVPGFLQSRKMIRGINAFNSVVLIQVMVADIGGVPAHGGGNLN